MTDTSNDTTRPAFDYVAEANVTLSQQFHGDKVSFFELRTTLTAAIAALQKLDKIKKTLFYGRDTGLPVPEHANSCASMFFDTKEEIILHGIIGKATEAGELLEQLYAVLSSMQPEFDLVNIEEEVGDGQWYDAVLAKACGFTIDGTQRKNIAKLRLRYKDKFDSYDANNRDLTAERAVLEGTAEQVRKIEMSTPYGKFAGVAPGATPTDNGAFNALSQGEDIAAECELTGAFEIPANQLNRTTD